MHLFLNTISIIILNSAVEVVGPIFENPIKYGFALNPGNPLTEAVTLELLEGKENDLDRETTPQITSEIGA